MRTLARIPDKKISFVVQGPIVGANAQDKNEQHTRRCIASIRKHFPRSEIVLSTWKGANTTGLVVDQLIYNDDPGGHICNTRLKTYNNVNRQIVSTLNGLRQATRDYAVKIRTDTMILDSAFTASLSAYPVRDASASIVTERIVIPIQGSNAPERTGMLFKLSDLFMFGRRKDLIDVWDIPLVKEPTFSCWLEKKKATLCSTYYPAGYTFRYFPEQYVWLAFFRKHTPFPYEIHRPYTKQQLRTFERFVASNLLFLDAQDLGIEYLKYPAWRKTEKIQYGEYTPKEWLGLYAHYCDPQARVGFDTTLLIKRIAYPAVKTRHVLQAVRTR